MKSIRVTLPQHLRTLAQAGVEVELQVEGVVTQRSVLDALETRYPMLRGTIRDHVTQQRRPFLRFFACEEDLPTNRRILRYPTRSLLGQSRFLSSERLPAVSGRNGLMLAKRRRHEYPIHSLIPKVQWRIDR